MMWSGREKRRLCLPKSCLKIVIIFVYGTLYNIVNCPGVFFTRGTVNITTPVPNNISHHDMIFEWENTYSSPEKEITRRST